MPELTQIEQQPGPIPAIIDQKQPKQRKPTKRIRHAVDLLLSGECKTRKAAAQRLNLAPEHFYRSLKEPHVLAYIERQTHIFLAQSQAGAAAVMLELLEDAKSESVRKDVAIHLLSIAGHKPANSSQVSVNVGVQLAGYCIMLADEPRPMLDVTP